MNDARIAGNTKEAIDILGNKWTYECMGCAIVNGSLTPPGNIIYNSERFILAADPEVPVPGFLVVNSKRHIRSISDLTVQERIEMINIVAHAEKALKQLDIASEITIVQEERSKHLHIWIFPTTDWMIEKFGKGIQYLRDIFTYAQEHVKDETISNTLKYIELVRNYFIEHDINN